MSALGTKRQLRRLMPIRILRNSRFEQYESLQSRLNETQLELEHTRHENSIFSNALSIVAGQDLMGLLKHSHSQLGQDIFVASETRCKRNGYFVEFGATDGLGLSNTWLLESQLGWSGILAEPGRCWHKELRKNRKAEIETQCVWSSTGGTLVFNETMIRELSTIDDYSSSDSHAALRLDGMKYEVSTISLLDLLIKHGAPKKMDYLSIDTEGSEYEILRNFDFDRYSFKIITCEHSFRPQRQDLFNLLTEHGYERKLENISQYDDWYVRK